MPGYLVLFVASLFFYEPQTNSLTFTKANMAGAGAETRDIEGNEKKKVGLSVCLH